jgi:hypothetical protein
LHAEEGSPEEEGMEVVTRAGMVVTLLATEGIMEVMPATRMDGLQRAQRRGITSRIRILVPPIDKISEDCLQLGEKQWQRIPAEKAKNGLESRFE